jgi:hypothetical protein
MAVWGGVYGAATLGVFAALGYIRLGISWGANGFGEYSADLLTLVNPAGTSRFLRALPVAPGRYEGCGYVGSSLLVLSVIVMVIIWYNPNVLRSCSLKPWVPLGSCVGLFAIFALSSKVTLAGQPILMLGHFYRPFMEIVSPFRTSGRFIWPLHYLWITVTVALWITFYHSSRFILSVIFIAVTIVQIIDFRGQVL